ncbi:MAG TPA: type 1 glutamine amidotransferase [Casimicrobiaceae bacterium]|jgi:GMP synthase-like glutamine amidotransferase
MRPIAIFRFSPTEGPAHFAEWLDAHEIGWQLVKIDGGEAVPPDPRAFGGIGLMGGPMSVTDSLPWSEPVSAFLRNAVEHDVPVIGHCLGGQLLAYALGARVFRAPTPEIGWVDVESADASSRAEWFGGRERFTAFQWHYDAFDLPAGATRVLANRFHPNQAYILGDRHIGFQCHVEMTRPLVETWCRTGADELPAASSPSRQSRADILHDVDERVATLNGIADGIYARWARNLRD